MFSSHFINDRIGILRREGGESFACLGISPFTAELNASFVTLSLADMVGHNSVVGDRLVGRQVLPERGSFTTQPPLEALPGESDALGGVLLTSPVRRTQCGFIQHLKFLPAPEGVVVVGFCQRSGETLAPQ